MCGSIALFLIFGLTVTKYHSGASRATIDVSRSILVWFFFLLFGNEIVREHFQWLQLLGFIVIILGILIFNEILIIPYVTRIADVR